MFNNYRLTRVFTIAAVFTVAGAALRTQSSWQYPQTRSVDQVDTYHGARVQAPYRWLEDDTAAETAAWVQAQNRITFPYLEKFPFRAALQKRVKQLNDDEECTSPSRKGQYVFFRKNAGLQNQRVLYIQRA